MLIDELIQEIYIEGKLLNSQAGVKSKFQGDDGNVYGVEQYVLQHYSKLQWSGIHCEGSVFKTLFALLMWDCIFADIPDVFQTPFQGTKIFCQGTKSKSSVSLLKITEFKFVEFHQI